jgi:hypothetical protein
MTTSTTLAPVIDGLLALAKTTFSDGSVQVMDGEPNQDPALDLTYLVVGVETGDTESGPITEGPIGALAMWEEYTIGCRIEYNGGDLEQSVSRNAVFTAYQKFLAAVQANPQLTGYIPHSGWIRPASVAYQQTSQGDLSADGMGRRAQINFTFSVRNQLQLS